MDIPSNAIKVSGYLGSPEYPVIGGTTNDSNKSNEQHPRHLINVDFQLQSLCDSFLHEKKLRSDTAMHHRLQ